MEKLKFKNGDLMPIIGLGTWKAGTGEIYKSVRDALKMGYRHFDCAHIYGNEVEIGEALADAIKEGEVSREELWITSKLWNDAHEPHRVGEALQVTLDALQTNYLDLYLMHWPIPVKWGIAFPETKDDLFSWDEVPVSSTWKMMEKFVDQGKIRHIGTSNFTVKKLKDLISCAAILPEVNQVELHPYLQQKELVQFCTQKGIHTTAYCSLGSGDRPKELKTDQEKSLLDNSLVMEIAAERKLTPAQVLLQWALELGINVIPKSTNPERLKQNLNNLPVQLKTSDMQKLASLDEHARYVHGRYWTIEGSPFTISDIWDETEIV